MAKPEDWRDRAYWEAIERREHAASQDYDKAILTLSAATLALSATFVHDIAPHPVADSKLLLIASWAALIIAIGAVVVSYLSSQVAHRRAMRDVDATAPSSVTMVLNITSGLCFVTGIVLFAIFAFVNL